MLPRLVRQRLLDHPLRRRDVGVRRRRQLRDPLEAVVLRHARATAATCAASSRCWSPRPVASTSTRSAGRGASWPSSGRGARPTSPSSSRRGSRSSCWPGCSTCPPATSPTSPRRYWAMQRGVHWDPVAEEAGRDAIAELTDVLRARWSRPDGPTRATTSCRPSHARPRRRTDHRRGRGGHPARGRPRDAPRQPGQPVVPAAQPPRPARRGHRGAPSRQARLPRGAAPLPAGAGRRPLRPPRGRALRSTAARGRPGDLLGGRRQPGPAGVPRRPRRLRRAAQGPVPARAARAVPGRRPALGHRLRARSSPRSTRRCPRTGPGRSTPSAATPW